MEELFAKIGLSEKERDIYLAVLKAGKISPQRVATVTGINRTTVYSVAKKLTQLGLLSEDLGQKVAYLSPESPERIVALFEREEKKLAEQKEAATLLAKELASVSSEKHYSVPRIKFIEEADLSAYLYAEYDRWEKSIATHGNIWWGFQDDSFTSLYGEWIDWCWKRAPESLAVRFFSNGSNVEEEMNKKYPTRVVKPLPSGTNFDSCLWVAGDYLLMAQTRMRPHYLVEIHDEVLARNQRELFKALWESA